MNDRKDERLNPGSDANSQGQAGANSRQRSQAEADARTRQRKEQAGTERDDVHQPEDTAVPVEKSNIG